MSATLTGGLVPGLHARHPAPHLSSGQDVTAAAGVAQQRGGEPQGDDRAVGRRLRLGLRRGRHRGRAGVVSEACAERVRDGHALVTPGRQIGFPKP